MVATEHVETALYELGENAIKHTGEDPSVEFAVDPDAGDDERVAVVVSDDGPGLPAHERNLLEGGSETKLEHGSGLGLWLVYWAITDAGGTIDVVVDDGTTIRVLLWNPDADAAVRAREPLTAIGTGST